ncbi:MAG: hypothetical protein ABUS49_10920 [Acidobacteriota bacterium]
MKWPEICHNIAEMRPARYLCSHLVTLSRREGAVIVNLEEIYTGGAVLESETPLPADAEVELRCGAVCFAGKVTAAEEHAFGWRISLEFSPRTPWSPDLFRPEHLLDPASIAAARNTRSEP